MVTRRQAREWALQLLVQFDLNPPADIAAATADFWQQQAALEADVRAENAAATPAIFTSTRPEVLASLAGARAFAERHVNGVMLRRDELDAQLVSFLKNWAICRLGTIERNVLRLGLWELLECPDIPAPIVVNEAVDLAKYFSETRSGRFVNAVLDAIAKSLPAVPAAKTAECEEFTP